MHMCREKVSPVKSSSNAEAGYLKKPQNEDLINSISALTNTRLTESRSEMITMINKNGDQPMSLGDRDSYFEDFETNNVPKGEKGKTGDNHSNDLSVLFKNITENINNAPVPVDGQKRTITNSDDGNNTPAKVQCCQHPAKTASDVEVVLEILNQVDQEHQILQNFGDAISKKLVTVKKNTGHMNQKNLTILKNYMKNY